LIAYELIVGERAFSGSSVEVALAKLERDGPDPRERCAVPDGIAEIIVRLLKRDPAERPASAAEVARSVQNAVARQRDQPTDSFTVKEARDEVPPLPSPGAKIAVLPFRYRGPSENEYLGDALAEDLIDCLSRLKGVR